jgi:hypothetical protein
VLEEQEEQMLHRVFGFADLAAAGDGAATEIIAWEPIDAEALVDHIARGAIRACRYGTTSTTSSASST